MAARIQFPVHYRSKPPPLAHALRQAEKPPNPPLQTIRLSAEGSGWAILDYWRSAGVRCRLQLGPCGVSCGLFDTGEVKWRYLAQ